MASGYMSAVEKHLPEAILVIDRFHLVKYISDKLTTLRRQQTREADESEKELLKGTRWLLVTGRKRLDLHSLLPERRTCCSLVKGLEGRSRTGLTIRYPLESLKHLTGKIRRLLKNTCGLRDQEYMFLSIQNLMYAKPEGPIIIG
jgi:hypothetical protein